MQSSLDNELPSKKIKLASWDGAKIPQAQSTCLVPITTTNNTSDDNEIPTWVLLEINGELILPREVTSEDTHHPHLPANHLELGLLYWDPQTISRNKECSKDDTTSNAATVQKPKLIVGTHQLTGRVQDLAQPFCVMHKRSGTIDSDNNHTIITSLEITGVVRQKIVFDDYPKTIMR